MRLSRRCSAARLISASVRSTAHCPQNCWSIRCAKILRGGAAPRRSAGRAGASAVETAGGAGYCCVLEGQYPAAGGGISGEPSPDADHPLPVDYIETLYGLVRSRLAVAILPALYTTHLQDPALRVAQLQQPALARTVALMRGPQALPRLLKTVFPCCRPPCARAGA